MKHPFKCFFILLLCACGGSHPTENDQAQDMSVLDTDSQAPDTGIAVENCLIESVLVEDEAGDFEIFRYEASGTAEIGVCSMEGKAPWHTITHGEASDACDRAGWRLCHLAELRRACEGRDRSRYPYGSTLIEGRCNIRDAYVPDGEDFSSAAPTGYFSQCVSQDGVFDLTGNVWEWTAREDDNYVYYGSGYRIIAERHRDDDHACNAYLTLPALVGEPYKKDTVGFRCCKDVVN